MKPWGIPARPTHGEVAAYPYHLRREIAPEIFETRPPFASTRPRVRGRRRHA